MNNQYHRVFKFLNWQLDEGKYQLTLNYEVESLGLVKEVLTFPPFSLKSLSTKIPSIHAACDLVHWFCGVSYYKSGLADQIVFEKNQPTLSMADFIQTTWFHGLAEMAYENNVSLHGRIKMKGVDKEAVKITAFNQSNRALIALGGGKDSLVSIEELKSKGKEFQVFMVGQSPLIKKMALQFNWPLIQVKRVLDPKLMEYNKQGAMNGHVPVTAINSGIAVLAALLFDFDQVVFSNERSAESANTTNQDGEPVNHQYSKSYAFEQGLQKAITREISTKLRYYSQQRRFSELAILEKFSHYPQYFSVFSSCNRNFHLKGSQNHRTLWCGNCPKCRFVFLGLAPFVSKNTLVGLFGVNLFQDQSQKQGFAELLGVKGFKPFECVGEIQESQLAYQLIKNKEEWQADALVEYFNDKCPIVSQEQSNFIMQPSTFKKTNDETIRINQ